MPAMIMTQQNHCKGEVSHPLAKEGYKADGRTMDCYLFVSDHLKYMHDGRHAKEKSEQYGDGEGGRVGPVGVGVGLCQLHVQYGFSREKHMTIRTGVVIVVRSHLESDSSLPRLKVREFRCWDPS